MDKSNKNNVIQFVQNPPKKPQIGQHDFNGWSVNPQNLLNYEKIEFLKTHYNIEDLRKIDWLGTFDLYPQNDENGTERNRKT